MANATTAQPASAPATVESLTVRVAELERALATQKADTADVKRQLAAVKAEKVGWWQGGKALVAMLGIVLVLQTGTNGYIIMLSIKNSAAIAALETKTDGIDNRLDGIDNRLDGIDNRLDRMEDQQEDRLDRIEDKLDRALPPR